MSGFAVAAGGTEDPRPAPVSHLRILGPYTPEPEPDVAPIIDLVEARAELAEVLPTTTPRSQPDAVICAW